jgi:hypothetical protein
MKKLLFAIGMCVCMCSQAQKRNYDTSLYVQAMVLSIEPSEKVGNWITLQATDSTGKIKYVARHSVDRQTRRNIGTCIMIPKDYWNDLPGSKY